MSNRESRLSRRGRSPSSLANLRPFRKGQSGNPHGRPRKMRKSDATQNSETAEKNTADLLALVLAADPQQVADELASRAEAGDDAARALADAILGRFGSETDWHKVAQPESGARVGETWNQESHSFAPRVAPVRALHTQGAGSEVRISPRDEPPLIVGRDWRSRLEQM